MSLNKTMIIGNLGRDPELRKTQNGTTVVSFSVAVNEGTGDKQKTTWFRCVAWEKTGEVIDKHLKKGEAALFEGRMSSRTYEKDGVEKEVWELTVDRMTFLPKTTADGGSDRGSAGRSGRDDDRRDDDRGGRGRDDRGRDDDRGRRDDRGRDDDRRDTRSRDDDWGKRANGGDPPATRTNAGDRSRRDFLDDEIPF